MKRFWLAAGLFLGLLSALVLGMVEDVRWALLWAVIVSASLWTLYWLAGRDGDLEEGKNDGQG